MASVKSLKFTAVAVAPGGDDGGFVDEIGDVGAGKTGRHPGDRVEIDVRREAHLAHVHLENLEPAVAVGTIHQHLAIEPSGPQQRRVEDFRPIGRGQEDDAGARIEAVEFGQELIERLLLLVGAAEAAGDAAAAQGVEFVDENDAGRGLARLLEQVAHPRGADADEHLDEFGAGNRKERHAGLAGDRLRQQRLAGSRRADQQDALRHPRPQPAVGLRIAQEGDQLLQLEFRLLDAGDILERHLGVRLHEDLGARLADRHEPAQPLLFGKAAKQEHPGHVKDDDGNDPGQDGLNDPAGSRAIDHDLVAGEFFGQLRIDTNDEELALAARQRLLQRALDRIGADRDLGDLVLIEQRLEFAVRYGLDLRVVAPELLEQQHADRGGQQDTRS